MSDDQFVNMDGLKRFVAAMVHYAIEEYDREWLRAFGLDFLAFLTPDLQRAEYFHRLALERVRAES